MVAPRKLADNKVAQNAGWNGELLKIERELLAKLGVRFDLKITGFRSGEMHFLEFGSSLPKS